jgi:hypothetical protein
MENIDIDALQRQLAERIASLDKQRQEQVAQFNAEAAKRSALADMERAQQLAKYEEENRRREAKKIAEQEAEQKKLQEDRRLRIETENALAAAEEARKKQEAALQWLMSEIAKQEFIEEQHAKAMQSAPVVETVVGVAEINVEHPQAPDNLGNAVPQTDGSTPETPLMSQHLKMILRQASRA